MQNLYTDITEVLLKKLRKKIKLDTPVQSIKLTN